MIKTKALATKQLVDYTREEHKINSRELLTNFNGYDIAIGLAATPTSSRTGRKYSALVLNLEK